MSEDDIVASVLQYPSPYVVITGGEPTLQLTASLCEKLHAKGRFLMMAPWEHQNERVPLTRSMCLALNQMAQQICCCALTADTMNAQQ